jgi:hypothetical protein
MKTTQPNPPTKRVADGEEIWARIGMGLIAVGFLVEAVKAAVEYFA